MIGTIAGNGNTTGGNNTYIGSYSAGSLRGTGNICIGYGSGPSTLYIANNRLYIDNWSGTSATSYIYGDMTPGSRYIRFNSNVSINSGFSSSYGLIVNGGSSTSYSIYAYKGGYTSGSWVSGSDARLKKDITPIENVLESIGYLTPVKYYWNIETFPDRYYNEDQQIGMIAQEMEKVFPELVSEDAEGFMAIAYDKFTAVLLAAIKEQQEEIEDSKSANLKLESELKSLREEVEQLKSLFSNIEK
jgi:hypothetical protein